MVALLPFILANCPRYFCTGKVSMQPNAWSLDLNFGRQEWKLLLMTGCQKWISVDLLWRSCHGGIGRAEGLLMQRNQRKRPFPPIVWREVQLYKCDLSGFVKLLCLEFAPKKPLTIRRFKFKSFPERHWRHFLLSIAVRFWLSLRNFSPFPVEIEIKTEILGLSASIRSWWAECCLSAFQERVLIGYGSVRLRSLHRPPQVSTGLWFSLMAKECSCALPCRECISCIFTVVKVGSESL